MSFADRLVLWLHIAVAIFTVGPVALAISSTPRYIRRRDIPVLRYLSRITVICTAASLLVLVLGIVLGNLVHVISRPWLTVSMTLFVVAIVLLALVVRDQRQAIRALAEARPDLAGSDAEEEAPDGLAASGTGQAGTGDGADRPVAHGALTAIATTSATAAQVASVERGRIAALGGIVNLLWLVILVLMVWRP
jgi:hypothetical protein